MKKLLLGAVMAAFVVTGAYGDDVINDKMQTAYADYLKEIDKCLDNTPQMIPNLKTAMRNLKDIVRSLLSVDQDDAAKKSTKYNGRIRKVSNNLNTAIDVINGLVINKDDKDKKEKLKEFKALVQFVKTEGDKLFEQNGSKKEIQSNFEGDTESKSNIENAYREVRHSLYTCWSDIERALTNKGIKTDVELAEEAAKKAAEEERNKDEALNAAQKMFEEEEKKAAEAEQAVRRAAGKSTKENTKKLLRIGNFR